MPKIEQLKNLAESIVDPENYFRGISLFLAEPPREVLLFTRRTQQMMLNFEPFSFHPRYVLVFCLQTPGRLVVEDRVYTYGPGEGMLIFPHQSHHYIDFDDEDICWFFVTFDLDDETTLAPLRGRSLRLDGATRTHVDTLMKAYLEQDENEELRGDSVVPQLCLLLRHLLIHAPEHTQPPLGEEPERKRQLLARIRDYVLGNLDQPLQLRDVARHVAISESHLRKIFRESFHTSLGAFIRRLRIHQACALLHETDRNISEIATGCGFNSLYAFGRALRRETGLSPTEYRRRFREKR